jgi:hypothetical protein
VQRAVCVAAPIAGDQDRRIRACEAQGLLQRADFTAATIAERTRALIADAAAQAAIASRVNALALGNGVDQAVDALGTMLGF